MSVYNNPLYHTQNNFVINTNDLSTTIEKSVNKNSSIHDQILDYVNQHPLKLEASRLQKPQFDRIQELLTDDFIIKARDDLFEISINLQDLITYLKIDRLEIVGGTVFWILGIEYMQEVCKKLNIPDHLIPPNFFSEFVRRAVDIDIRFWGIKDVEAFKKGVCAYLATKLPENYRDVIQKVKEQLILKFGLTKYFTQQDEVSKEHFGVISLGNRKDFSVDLLFIDSMKRKNLFKHDGVKIVITRESEQFTASLNSNGNDLFESFILKLTKMLDADDIDTINEAGASMLFSYLSKGWRYNSTDLESTLTATFLKTYDFKLLSKLIHNHYPNEPFAASIICFNACSVLPKHLILNVTHQLLKDQLPESSDLSHFHELLLHLNKLPINEAKLLFDAITAYFQIMGTLSKNMLDSKTEGLQIIETTIAKSQRFQIGFNFGTRTLYIVVKDDLIAALQNFKWILNYPPLLESLKKLHSHFVFIQGNLKISKILIDASPDTVSSKEAFDLLESKNLFLQEMGFYLLLAAGIAEQNSSYLNTLIFKFFDLLKNENLTSQKQNLLYSLIKYWLTTDQKTTLLHHSDTIEAIYEGLDKCDEKMLFLAFSKFEIPAVTNFIFNTWQKKLKTFEAKESCGLIENFKNHDPLSALKVLKALVEEPTSKYELLKKQYDSLLAAYSNPKNQLLEARDLELIAEVTEKLINKMPSFKQPPKQDEINLFIVISKKLMLLDVSRGTKLLKKLEEKKACINGLKQIFRDSTIDDKSKFIEELILKPIDSNANVILLVERIEIILTSYSAELGLELTALVGTEILNLLGRFFKAKKPNVDKLKIILNPHLSWLLFQLLNQEKIDENRQETIMIYFKIADALNPKIIFNENLIASLISHLKAILMKDNTQIEFVKSHLSKVEKRNLKSIKEEELELYALLVAISLKTNQTIVASDFIKKMLIAYASQNLPQTSHLIAACDAVLNQLILNKQFENALSLIDNQEKLFPENPLPDAFSKWKELTLKLDEKQKVKKMELLIKKAELLNSDVSLISLAEEIAISLIKPKCPIDQILKLINSYRLKNLKLVKHLKNCLISLKDKELTESAFSSFQNSHVSLHGLTPLFTPLSLVESDLMMIFYNNLVEILVEVDLAEKAGLIQEFISGFLKSPLLIPWEKEKVFLYLENALKLCDSYTFDMQNEIDLNYCKTFVSIENNDIFTIWTKLNSLLINLHKKEDLAEIPNLFIKGIISFRKSGFLEKAIEPYLILFLSNAIEKIHPTRMISYFDFLPIDPSPELLNQLFAWAAAIIEFCPIKDPEKLTKPYLDFKVQLNKIIDFCFEKDKLKVLHFLLKAEFSTWEEIYYYKGRISKALFSEPNINNEVDSIEFALKHYNDNLSSLHECVEFQEENLISAMDCVTSLVFIHDDIKSYLEQLNLLSVKIDVQGTTIYTNKSANSKKYIKDTTFVKEKVFLFHYHLVKTVTEKLLSNKNQLTAPMIVLAINNISLVAHLLPYLDRSEKIISLALEFSYAISILPPKAQKDCISHLQRIVGELKQAGFLLETKSVESVKNVVQLFAMAQLSLVSIGIFDETKALFLLEMIKKIASINTCSSIKMALRYFNIHFALLATHCQAETVNLHILLETKEKKHEEQFWVNLLEDNTLG